MATVPPLSDPFKLSYGDFESYPHNLIYRAACTAVLKAYEARLDEASPSLFIEEDEQADVPFRDFRGEAGQGKFSHSSSHVFSTNTTCSF